MKQKIKIPWPIETQLNEGSCNDRRYCSQWQKHRTTTGILKKKWLDDQRNAKNLTITAVEWKVDSINAGASDRIDRKRFRPRSATKRITKTMILTLKIETIVIKIATTKQFKMGEKCYKHYKDLCRRVRSGRIRRRGRCIMTRLRMSRPITARWEPSRPEGDSCPRRPLYLRRTSRSLAGFPPIEGVGKWTYRRSSEERRRSARRRCRRRLASRRHRCCRWQ